MKIHVNGVDLFVDAASPCLISCDGRLTERPSVLMLHGGPGGDHAGSRLLGDALGRHAAVIYFDQRGHGRSDVSTSDHWRLDQWADDAAALVRTLGLASPVLLGSSFGGMVALTAALRHPRLFSRLVLVSTASHAKPARMHDAFAALGGAEARAVSENFLEAPDDLDALAAFQTYLLPHYSRRAGADIAARASVDDRDRALLRHFFGPGGEAQSLDLRARLAALRLPMLVLHGRHDPAIPLATALEMVDAFAPGVARLRVFDDASHLLAIDAPEIIQAIVDFLGDRP